MNKQVSTTTKINLPIFFRLPDIRYAFERLLDLSAHERIEDSGKGIHSQTETWQQTQRHLCHR